MGQAQNSSPAPDIPLLTQKAQAGDIEAMMALGEAYLEGDGTRRDLDAAIGWFATAAQTSDANALYQLSYALRERGKPDDLALALRYGIAASALAKRSGSAAFQASIQLQLGYVYDKLNRFEEAIAAYEAARRIAERKPGQDRLQIVAVYFNLANSLAGAGRQEESVAATKRAIEVLAKIPGSDRRLLANLYTNEAISLTILARYGEALDALDEALAIYENLNIPEISGVANVLKTKSRVYTLLARYEDAVKAARSALAIYAKSESPDQHEVAATYGTLGLAFQGLERHADARVQYLAAAKILESNYGANTIEMMNPLINLGNVDDELGHFEDALTNYNRALALIMDSLGPDHADVATMLGRLGNTSRKLERYDDALNYGLHALLIQTNAADADIDNQRYTFRMLARTFAAKGNRGVAMLFAKSAVNAHQALRARNSTLTDALRSAFGQSFQPSYRLLSELLLSDGQFSEAQFAGGLLKQEEFHEFTQIAEKSADTDPGVIRLTKPEARIWTEIQERMTPARKIAAEMRALAAARAKTGTATPEAQARLRDLATRRDEAVRTFVASTLELIGRNETRMLLRQKETLDLSQDYARKVQTDLNAMGPNVVLLQAMSLEDGLHLFVSAAGFETIHREVPASRSDLANKISATLAAIEGRSDDTNAKLAELYDLLIRPVRSDLDAAVDRAGANTPTLLLDLSGFLRYVPFAALYGGRHYLVEDYALALYNPAVPTKFAAMRRGNIKGAGFGVAREHPGFPALPGAVRELDAVFHIVEGTTKLDDEFSDDALAKALAAKPQLLHIASHFRFRPGNETNSYLLLGNGAGLTLSQLRTQKRFRFNGIDLITLSACETARGGGAEGEEIESFGALAQEKGASAVLSTLWQIADESTARLMTDFYDGLVNQGLDKAHALQRAQLALIKGETAQQSAQHANRSMTVVEDASAATDLDAAPTSHPYYWAAFTLMGNWM
ncbi:CHAT domain-containing protein [Taklimakanibacter lacteus]|uniref:CHAT domain-containing protein n=1 Tax=Taklimakanibacter lacteus TaxID=2268456 RepID=UPI0013C512B2